MIVFKIAILVMNIKLAFVLGNKPATGANSLPVLNVSALPPVVRTIPLQGGGFASP
jgi:hypothetical protein